MLLLPLAEAADLRGDDVWLGDGAATGGLAIVWIASEGSKSYLAPDACRICEPPGFDVAIRNAVRWRDTTTPDHASTILGMGVLPVGGLAAAWIFSGPDADPNQRAHDLLYVSEAVALAAVVNQGVKFAAGRQRPFVWGGDAPPGDDAHARADYNLSFYSGHTSLAFSVVGAASTVAWLRGDERWWVPAAVGAPLALGVGYLRMGADKHWFSDVLVGAVAGSAIGIGTPLLLHGHPDTAKVAVGVEMGEVPLISLGGVF